MPRKLWAVAWLEILGGLRRYAKIAIKNRIKEVLTKVKMETKDFKFPHELSGGEQQRVA